MRGSWWQLRLPRIAGIVVATILFGTIYLVAQQLDRLSANDGPLRLACLWARWMVRRLLSDNGAGGSLDRVAGLIDEARRALDRVTTVRRCHTSATKRIGEATIQIDEMGAEVEIVLDAIVSEIAR